MTERTQKKNILPEGLLFGEANFEERMRKEVQPWLKNQVKDGYFRSWDGSRIHYLSAVHPRERAAVVFSHGFCEFSGKYHEMMYYFYQMGYSVFFMEHRGHGFSRRFLKDLHKVYVKSYQEYVKDLHVFVDGIVKKRSKSGELYLFAHSMGGAIGALFLEEYPEVFSKAVLSSPMMELNFGNVADWQAALLAAWSVIARWDTRYVPGQKGFDYTYSFAGSSCLSEVRYAYVFRQRKQTPEYRTYGGTYAWARASLRATRRLEKYADRVKIPVLLLQAGKDTMVKPGGQEEFAARSKNTKLVRFPESKHEIFNGTARIRERYYREVFAFYES